MDNYPLFSPDGSHVAFHSIRGGKWGVWIKAVAGGGHEERLFEWRSNAYLSDWSRDGRYLFFDTLSQAGRDVYFVPMTGYSAGAPVSFLQSTAGAGNAQLSPDGKWLAFTSTEGGAAQIYVVSFPGKESKMQISNDGGVAPRWSPDGRELFYIGRDRRMMAVAVTPDARFEHGAPQPLFDSGGGSLRGWWLSSDGKRFLIPVAEDTAAAPVHVIINWLAGVKK